MDDPVRYADRTGDALKAALIAFQYAGHNANQLLNLIKMLRPGDRVVCAHDLEARQVAQAIDQHKLEGIWVVAGAPHNGQPLGANCNFLNNRMPTYFTPAWYQAYYRRELQLMDHRLQELEGVVQGPRHEREVLGCS